MNKQQSIQMILGRIDKSENISKKYGIRFTKHYLKKRIMNFPLKEFCCFGDDGNTVLEPDVYYSENTEKRELWQFNSVETQLFHHTVCGDMTAKVKFKTPEFGTNLLRCCKRCADLWLKTMFHFNFIKHLFENSTDWFEKYGGSLQICKDCNKSEICGIHFQKEGWFCRDCFEKDSNITLSNKGKEENS